MQVTKAWPSHQVGRRDEGWNMELRAKSDIEVETYDELRDCLGVWF